MFLAIQVPGLIELNFQFTKDTLYLKLRDSFSEFLADKKWQWDMGSSLY